MVVTGTVPVISCSMLLKIVLISVSVIRDRFFIGPRNTCGNKFIMFIFYNKKWFLLLFSLDRTTNKTL